MRDDIVGYVFDCLDPDEQERIEERMERDPQFRAAVERVRRLLRPLAMDDCVEPPAGLCERTLAFVHGASAARSRAEWAPSRSAARLVDYMVAASLLIVSATVLLPALSQVQLEQRRLACADQLHHLGVALAMYAEQEGGQLPYVAPQGPMNNAGIFTVLLKSRDLIADGKSLVCVASDNLPVALPAQEEYLAAQNSPAYLRFLRRRMAGSYGYALGYRQVGYHHGLCLRNDARPVVSDRPPRVDDGPSANSPNHLGRGQNVLFADGNVRWLTTANFAGDDLFHNQAGMVGAGLGSSDTVIGVSEATPYPMIEL